MIKYFTIEDLLKHYLQKKFHILAFAAMNGEYLTWDFNDPELAIVGTLLHGFEFLFIRLAPFLLTGSIIGIVFTYKKR